MSTPLSQNDQNLVKTLCKDCIFSEKDWFTNHQIGCKKGRIQLYQEAGVKIDIEMDSGGKYYIINGRYCNSCRNHKWLEYHEIPPTDQQLIDWHLWQENAIKYDVIIISNESKIAVLKTIDSLRNQEYLPQAVTVICNESDEQLAVASFLKKYFLSTRIPFKWNVRITSDDIDKNIDYIVNHQASHFYSVANANYKYNKRIFSKINSDILFKIKQYPVILPDSEGNGGFVQVFLHKHLGGNFPVNIFQKIKEANLKCPTITEIL